MRKSVPRTALLCLAFSALWLSCGSGKRETPAGGAAAAAAGGPGAMVIGFSQIENRNPWRIAQTLSIQEEAARRGIRLVYTDAEHDTAKQIEDVRYLLAQGIRYLILDPREYKESAAALVLAKEAGVPVIIIDRLVMGVPGEDYVVSIRSDFFDEGRMAAQWLVDRLGGTGNLVILSGTKESSAAMDRQAGFMSVVHAHPGVAILRTEDADFLRSLAQRTMEQIIQTEKRPIHGVFCHNDEMAIGAIQALKAAGFKPGEDVVVVGIDGALDALKAIIAGEMGATVTCDPYYGPLVFDVIERLEAGEKVPVSIIIPERLIDKRNAVEELPRAF